MKTDLKISISNETKEILLMKREYDQIVEKILMHKENGTSDLIASINISGSEIGKGLDMALINSIDRHLLKSSDDEVMI